MNQARGGLAGRVRLGVTQAQPRAQLPRAALPRGGVTMRLDTELWAP